MITSLRAFAWKDLFAYKTRFCIGSLSLALGIAFALLLLVLTNSLGTFAAQKATDSMGVDEVLITPSYAPGLFGVTKSIKRPLDAKAVEEMKKLPGVVDVRLENVVEHPTSLMIDLFNTKFETDSAMYGIADSEFDKRAKRTVKNPDHIPVLISKEMIDIYNVGIAQAVHKPLVNEDFLVGYVFDLHLGYSSFFRDQTNQKAEVQKAEVVGVVSGIPIVGVTTRFSTVEAINKRLKEENSSPSYIRAYLKTSPGTVYETLKASVTGMGFEASSFDERLGPIRSQLSYVYMILSGVIGMVFLIIALTVFYLFYSQYIEKRYTLAVMKTLGATAGDIARFFLYQALTLYGSALILGAILAAAAVYLLRLALTAALGDSFTGVTDSIRILPADIAIIGAIALVLTLCCVALPTMLAQQLSPRSVLADR
ncbi:hypothetical protein COW46_04620 [Candidatus Gracilibacteria bacterium CG17_big_fil_post_rev_8_21_14_2_50_48_13]|nr:MAG: hypothetical protein COW46_04620 [Candidatus Gracilibacteria bacterium CG17_big_fil_post_rev_8_21_14_2_50_48_13]